MAGQHPEKTLCQNHRPAEVCQGQICKCQAIPHQIRATIAKKRVKPVLALVDFLERRIADRLIRLEPRHIRTFLSGKTKKQVSFSQKRAWVLIEGQTTDLNFKRFQ